MNRVLHLLATIAGLALSAYAFTRIFDGPQAWNVVLWFAGAIVAHDLIAWPLYTALDRVAQRALPSPAALNHVRIPALLSGLLFVVYFPLILGLSADRYERSTGLSADVYLGRWLLITGGLFAGSAVVYALRARRLRRRGAASRGSSGATTTTGSA